MNEKAEALQRMTETEGWKLVEAYIKERAEASKNQLMHCDIEDVIKHRAKAEALKSVLSYINKTIEEGRSSDA